MFAIDRKSANLISIIFEKGLKLGMYSLNSALGNSVLSRQKMNSGICTHTERSLRWDIQRSG